MSTLLDIPLPEGSPSFEQRVTLSGAEYLMVIEWNELESRWYLDLYDIDRDPILLGVKLVLGAEFLRRTQDARRPPGKLILSDTTSSNTDAGLTDLGTRVRLLYVDP